MTSKDQVALGRAVRLAAKDFREQVRQKIVADERLLGAHEIQIRLPLEDLLVFWHEQPDSSVKQRELKLLAGRIQNLCPDLVVAPMPRPGNPPTVADDLRNMALARQGNDLLRRLQGKKQNLDRKRNEATAGHVRRIAPIIRRLCPGRPLPPAALAREWTLGAIEARTKTLKNPPTVEAPALDVLLYSMLAWSMGIGASPQKAKQHLERGRKLLKSAIPKNAIERDDEEQLGYF